MNRLHVLIHRVSVYLFMAVFISLLKFDKILLISYFRHFVK